MQYRSEILIEPIEALAKRVGTGERAVPALINDVLLVLRWRAQVAKDRELRRLQGKRLIVTSVEHEHRNGYMGHKVERIDLRKIVAERKTSRGQDRHFYPALYRR